MPLNNTFSSKLKSTCTVDTSNPDSTGAETLVVIHGDALIDGKYCFVSRNVQLGILTVDNGLNFQWKSTKFWAPQMQKANHEFKARKNKRKESDYSN